jgi:hypothetical protein
MIGIEKEMARVRSKQKNISDKHLLSTSTKMLTDLKVKTPVDTGLARDSWKIASVWLGKPFSFLNVKNDVPYISRLNQGSSKQAPKYFVELTALKYGRPFGNIVNHD